MDFITSYYWQQGKNVHNSSSLLLQQLSFKKGKGQLLLACVCEEEQERRYPKTQIRRQTYGAGCVSGYMTQRLDVWFHERAVKHLGGRKKGSVSALEKELSDIIQKTDSELGGICVSLCGLLCKGRDFLLFYRGGTELYLLNTRFGRANLRSLSGESETLSLQCGEIRKGAGVLLAVRGFCEGVGEQPLRECLAAGETSTQERADKRLTELGYETERRNMNNVGAILVFAK